MLRCVLVYMFSLFTLVFSCQSYAGFKEGMDAIKRQDFTAAYKEWKEAAEHDDSDAQYAFAMLNYQGQGVSQNYQQALYWFTKVAEKGKAPAQFFVGSMYDKGQGVAKDFQQAMNWYTKAAEQGFALAQINLGTMYFNGTAVKQDFKKTAYWYTKAAEQGNAIAEYRLGAAYLNGRGVDRDSKQAVVWFTKAAEQGLIDAQHDLAVMYFDGQGVDTDMGKAAHWYALASALGDDDSQYNLAMQYYKGRGVKKDNVIAFALLSLSNSKKCGEISGYMVTYNEISANEIAIANKLKDQMKKNGNFISALNNYEKTHTVDEISSDVTLVASGSGKNDALTVAGTQSNRSLIVNSDYVKNGMPCMDGICVGDPVSILKGIKWDKVKKYVFRPDPIMGMGGFKTENAQLEFLKSHFSPEKRNLVEKISAYLIQSKFDNGILNDLSNLNGICEPFKGDRSSLIFMEHSQIAVDQFNDRINSEPFLMTDAYEMRGTYTSAGGNKTTVTIALSINRNPDQQVMRIKEIRREYSKNATQEQLAEILSQLKMRYNGIPFLRNGWDEVSKIMGGNASLSAWSFDNGDLVLRSSYIKESEVTINYLKKYSGCSQNIKID